MQRGRQGQPRVARCQVSYVARWSSSLCQRLHSHLVVGKGTQPVTRGHLYTWAALEGQVGKQMKFTIRYRSRGE
jgi:hypothetical protein